MSTPPQPRNLPFAKDFYAIHELGAKEFPAHWMQANRVSIDAMRAAGIEPSANNEIKCATSLVVFRVLDGAVGRASEADAPAQPPAAGDATHCLKKGVTYYNVHGNMRCFRTAIEERETGRIIGEIVIRYDWSKDGEERKAHEESITYANRIVRACNSHAALVEALCAAKRELNALLASRQIDSTTQPFFDLRRIRDGVEAALAAANS